MDKVTELKLASIFQARQHKIDLARRMNAEKESSELEFFRRFLVHRDDVVRPVFESFALAVEGEGIDCRISTSEERMTQDRQDETAGISITFLIGEVGRLRDLQQYPHLTITCDKMAQRVRIDVSTIAPGRGGQESTIGAFPMEEVETSFLTETLLDLLQKILI